MGGDSDVEVYVELEDKGGGGEDLRRPELQQDVSATQV